MDDEFQALLAETIKTGDADDTAKLVEMVNEADNVHPMAYSNLYFAYRADVINTIQPKNDNWVLPGDYTYNYDAPELYD